MRTRVEDKYIDFMSRAKGFQCMYRVALFGECYSTNLGDVVIADTTKYLLSQILINTQVIDCDLSGRKTSSVNHQRNNIFKNIHQAARNRSAFYRKMLNFTLWHLRDKRTAYNMWHQAIISADFCVVSGGQLLMDNDLGFPLKIHTFVQLAAKYRKPIVFLGCGVGEHWSKVARYLFAHALNSSHILAIYVRDHQSQKNLVKHLPSLTHKVESSSDAALWSAETYGIHHNSQSAVIGLGITSPNVLKRYKPSTHYAWMLDFWEEVALRLYKDGHVFQLFTNGAVEDQQFAEVVAHRITGKIRSLEGKLIAPRPEQGPDLVRQISQFRAVVAHRLHANIIAYSLNIPSVGLIWDHKLRWFGEETERSAFFLDTDKYDADKVVDNLYIAINEGINKKRRDVLKYIQLEQLKDIINIVRLPHKDNISYS